MEQLMQYVWQHRLWPAIHKLSTIDGRSVEVIDQGTLNTGPGPDFFNAKIKIASQIWAGDVEIHVRASDWYRHGHQNDEAYKSVILHVVDRSDREVNRPGSIEVIPQMVLPCNPELYRSCSELIDRSDIDLPCAQVLRNTPEVYLTDWFSALGFERLYEKAERVKKLLDRYKGDWERVCYITLARALGFGTNADPMQRTMESLPLMVVSKHADSLLHCEALLLGQAGLLDKGDQSVGYVRRVCDEYRFMRQKFGLRPIESPGWRMGTRPGNFPHRRLALLAQFLHSGEPLMSTLMQLENAGEIRRFFNRELTGHWALHFNLGPHTFPYEHTPLMSESTLNLLIINTINPIRVAYALFHGDDACQTMEKAVDLLESLPAERNRLTDTFTRIGLRCDDAFTSQAMIQLRRQYCECHKCLYCRFGHRALSGHALRTTAPSF